ncbi:MAG: class I SAM-dependent DNA methyltransferase [Acidimicrobiia bacterium]
MLGYDETTYGAEWAARYDAFFPEVAEGMIDRLAELAENGTVLELAIGTGRVALPLASRGLKVSGIDISPEMVSLLRKKPGGAKIPVVMGDFVNVAVDGEFKLIYLVSNTLFGLLRQAEQVRCFANVVPHLENVGRFLIEAFVPDLGRFDRGQRVQAIKVLREQAVIEVSQHDLVNQLVTSQWVWLSPTGIELRPVNIRYAWPSELDLMAQLAGLELEVRWGGWEKEPFTSVSPRHVSVYKVPAP